MEDKKILLDNINKIHTTEMGVDRIKRNLKIDTVDVVEYCKNKIVDENCHIYKQGKNWYCEIENIKITINSYSYTIITAHIIVNYNRGGNMASSKEYLDFILGQLSELEDITYRAMMGEFIIYYRGKIVGGIYDDRLLVKPVKSAISYIPAARYELPYEGAKEMLLVDEVDNKDFLTGLFNAMYDELPNLKKKKITIPSLSN